MPTPDPIDDLLARIARVLEHSPAGDLPRRLRTVLEQGLQQFDLATRADLEAYAQWASALRQRVEQLEARIAQLEGRAQGEGP